MVRTVALLVAAISMSRPAIPKDEATRYAKILNEIGSKYDFDPLYAVAMIHHESHWSPGVSSEDGEDFGLGQVRARYVGACRDDEDPIGNPSEACKAVKAQLLVGETNLRHVGSIIGANKKMCAEKRGKNKPELWIAGYQGLSQPERNKYCVPGPTTTRVIDYHKDLVAALLPAPKAKGAAVAKGSAPAKGAVAAKGSTPAKGAAPAKAATASTTKAGAAAKASATASTRSAAAAKAAAKNEPAAKATTAKATTAKAAAAKATTAKAGAAKDTRSAKPKQAKTKPAPARAR